MAKTFSVTVCNTSDKPLRIKYGDDTGALTEATVAPGDSFDVQADETWQVDVRAIGVDNGQPELGTDTRGA
jgi:hypothetical protein